MADYDWFKPSQEELNRQAAERAWDKQHGVRSFTTSTAVGTTFYGCTVCGTMLLGRNYAPVHQATYHPDNVHPADKIKDQITNG